MKVYETITIIIAGRQQIAIVAAANREAARAAFGMSISTARRYLTVTGTPVKCAVALNAPGTVFVRDIDAKDNQFKPFRR